MTFSYVRERSKKTAPRFDQELDEATFEKDKSWNKLLRMSEKDFKLFVRGSAWKFSDGKLIQRPI